MLACCLAIHPVERLHAEVILQYFNTSWRDLAAKIPELAEVGYGALWLPPPTKGSGALSVGYDLWDPFDLGGQDQRGTVRTRYGTEAEFLRLIETAHRFGLRVYVDNIMNHRAFDVPGYNEYTPIDIYPGMVPEDFHLRVTAEGFYRKWDNVANWGDTWQVQYRNFSDLIDIAQEMPDNGNFGSSEGDHIPKIRLVRQPNHPEYYDYHPTLGWVGFDSSNITAQVIADHPAFYEEDVNAYLIRAVRWLVHHTRIDGLRLDAVKHVPAYFFGEQWAEGKDASSDGYCGQAQWQFNMTRGFNDWDNHRDTVFDTERTYGRNDLMMFGEHLGAPPSYDDYIAAGMRLVDNSLHGYLNGNLGQPWGNLSGLEHAGGQGFSPATGVAYIKSHDDDYATRPELQFALILTRQGLPNVYTDGNDQSETLGESGGAFPRHANTAFLGQWGDSRIPTLVYIHEHFARGDQWPRWGDADVVAYERNDKRENGDMEDADGAVLFFVLNDNYDSGAYREIQTTFRPGDYLWQYADGGGHFYYTVPADGKIKVITPPGGYFAFSWRSPEESDLWRGSGGRPLTIEENGRPAEWVAVERKDGPDGDPGFNPYGETDADATDFRYTHAVPRVHSSTNLRFVAHVDGSAANVLMKLDGGIDLNGTGRIGGDLRDYPPGNEGSTDVFLGYEQAGFVRRQYREKFAAVDTGTRNVIGSAGAETYTAIVGTAGFTVNPGLTGRDSDAETAQWVYHDPAGVNDTGQPQFAPAPENAADTNITLWVKLGYENQVNRVFVYYTTNGVSWPEGAGGEGRDATQVMEGAFDHDDAVESNVDWWRVSLPAMASGTPLRYKIGAFWQQGDGSWEIVWPGNAAAVEKKKSMLGVWAITNVQAATTVYYPHNDFGITATGLAEGFHVLRARAFLNRPGNASIFNTFVQPFYYDAQLPGGDIVYPGEGSTLEQNEYGVVVRTDPTVTDVWYHIEDSLAANDDGRTGQSHGNGTNEAGQAAWVRATQVSPSLSVTSDYPDEWRFSYRNIPSGGGAATIHVRLLELSSSTNMVLSDDDGHFATVSRHVFTDGPAYTLFVAYPSRDADLVDANYILRARFSKTLANTDDATLLSRFLITIDGEAQGRDLYTVDWDVDDEHHDLLYTLPDLYNGDTSYQHLIVVTHTNAAGGGVTLTANRLVRAREMPKGVYVDIVNPPEFDSDGKAYEIVLPDVADPSPEDRQFAVRVETDLTARDVWMVFSNSVGTAEAVRSVTSAVPGRVAVDAGAVSVTGHGVALTGTVAVTTNSVTLTGTDTAFATELAPGYPVRIDTQTHVVTEILSDTQATLDHLYSGPSASGLTAYVTTAFESWLKTDDRILIDDHVLFVQSIGSGSNLTLKAPYPGTTVTQATLNRIDHNPTTVGTRQYWHFNWTNLSPGPYTLLARVDTNGTRATIEASAVRHTTVVLREQVADNPDDADDDDDGLLDADENSPVDWPETNPETWLNGDVHIQQIFGRTRPIQPDTDGDGLPDGLESGWRVPLDLDATDIEADTNGDGFPNFLPDLDPPFYNTVPDNNGLPLYVFYDSRTKLIHGSMTDPNNPDSDSDGLRDGIEDANRNGWIDGDGKPLQPATANPWEDRPSAGDWPDGRWDAAWAAYPGRETNPNNADTDGDGAADGYGEDTNGNGRIDGDLNTNRVHETGEFWIETDPLNPDTDADGLPDGWEKRYALDPLNDGIPGHTRLSDGTVITTNEHGAAGNPDGDSVIVNGVTNDYTNLMEFENGTNPRLADTQELPAAGAITVGPGRMLGVLGDSEIREEFMDWSAEDCLVLDEHEGAGNNNQGGDVYRAWDGWDESRDIVAFYAHDGGDPGNGGDGRFYFRVDFYDLKAHAEDENLNLYVVIDTGNPDSGEMLLPDDVDTLTWNRWEAVVAVYRSGQGALFIDHQRDPANNTTTWGQNLLDPSYGIEARDQNTPDGFIDAYFNAELDSVEFSISRHALFEAGWNGFGASNFNYQVFTTKDGTGNNPVGPGDIGGRSDVRDAIVDDFIAEDYWQAQEGLESILKDGIPGTARAGRAKVAYVLHGNQAIQPGSVIQDLINTGAGSGYYRPLDVHALFAAPLTLHITPTLASAIQWADAAPAAGKPWRDGPAFNRRIADLVRTNVVYLCGTTFSDHMLPYFTRPFNRDNERLARDFLQAIYGVAPDPARAIFWTPERLLDADVCGKILDMGYGTTLIDQDTHLFNWYGRTESLIDGGYRLNRIAGVRAFVMHNQASTYLFENHDGGIPMALRALFNRKARSGTQDQVVTLFSPWEVFIDRARADAYDVNLRWLVNRPWTQVAALERIAAGEWDTWGGPEGDSWTVIDRPAPGSKQAHNWLNHASQGDFDHWYVGSPLEESLENQYFTIREGTNMGTRYGMLYTDGVIVDAWNAVESIAHAPVAAVARSVLHASVFQSAFHNEDNEDLRRYSTGAYMNPATSSNSLASFARNAQSQTRRAATYLTVDAWADTAAGLDGVYTESVDVDLDGEMEYLLYNSRLFAVFERQGGRLILAWVRSLQSDSLHQVMGNFTGYAGGDTESEGAYNVDPSGALVAFRTSGLKDWWVESGPGTGTVAYVNTMYTFSDAGDGWDMVSSDGAVQKSVRLTPHARRMEVAYHLGGAMTGGTIYVRHGLSPALADLLVNGQRGLTEERHEGGVMTLSYTGYVESASIRIGYGDDGHHATFNPAARDDHPGGGVTYDTVRMRNQAQTHQVELVGSNGLLSFSLEFGATLSDADGDGMPNVYEDGYPFLDAANPDDGDGDHDQDGMSNRDEYIAGSDPDAPSDDFTIGAEPSDDEPPGFRVRFDAIPRRLYRVFYQNQPIDPPAWSNATAVPITVASNGVYEWLDDGSSTVPHPSAVTGRFYRVEAELPE